MFLIPLLQHLTARAREEDGAITVEYGTLIALVVLVVAGAVTFFGSAVDTWIRDLAGLVTGAGGGGG